MDNRITELIEAFENNGWQFLGSVDIKSDWWFEEIISFQSKWSPVGKTLYLTLLADPMEIKRKVVWSISISTILPESNSHRSIGQIALNDFKRTELDVFVKDINKTVLK